MYLSHEIVANDSGLPYRSIYRSVPGRHQQASQLNLQQTARARAAPTWQSDVIVCAARDRSKFFSSFYLSHFTLNQIVSCAIDPHVDSYYCTCVPLAVCNFRSAQLLAGVTPRLALTCHANGDVWTNHQCDRFACYQLVCMLPIASFFLCDILLVDVIVHVSNACSTGHFYTFRFGDDIMVLGTR